MTAREGLPNLRQILQAIVISLQVFLQFSEDIAYNILTSLRVTVSLTKSKLPNLELPATPVVLNLQLPQLLLHCPICVNHMIYFFIYFFMLLSTHSV